MCGRHVAGVLAVCLGFVCSPAQAEVVRVFAAGAVQSALRQLEPAFTTATGHSIEARLDTVGALRDAILSGAPADVVILSDAAIAALVKADKIDRGSQRGIGITAVALAVRKGAVVPDVSTPEALRNALLKAASISYADPDRGATAGAHFARVLERLGITSDVAGRITVLPFGGDVIRAVAEGRFAMGVSQSSEILGAPGVELAGTLPPPYDHSTHYQAARLVDARPAATAFLAFLQGSEAQAAFAAIGFVEPKRP